MYIKNRYFRGSFRLLLVGASLLGIILTVMFFGAADTFETLSYYTLQSNIIVLVFFALLLPYSWRAKAKPPAFLSPTVKGGVTACITLTLIIYHFILVPTMFSTLEQTFDSSWSGALVHYIVPLMTIADWLLFDKKGLISRLDPLKWLIVPLAYFIFVLVRAQFATFSVMNSHYPYFFIDFDKLGVGQVAVNVLLIAIGYTLMGYLIYGLDWLLSKIRPRKPSL
jgi:hypothetical protein